VPLSRFVRTLLRQLVQELLKSGPEFPVLAKGQPSSKGGPANILRIMAMEEREEMEPGLEMGLALGNRGQAIGGQCLTLFA
jgi:hypothetical protein